VLSNNTTQNLSVSRYNTSALNAGGSVTNLSDSTRQLLAIRKNNYRQQQLKKIDSENLKIFQNLLRIKSNLSKVNMDKQDRKNSNLRQMLAHYDNRLDPLISIEQKMRARGGELGHKRGGR
jgi:hypothetical protein